MKYSLKSISIDDVNLLKSFYDKVYIKAFPNINERESLDNLLYYLKQKETGYYGDNNYHILIMHHKSNVIGGIIFDYFSISNSGVIEFICIADEYKRNGFASILYNQAIQIINEDAQKVYSKNPDYIFAEIDYVTSEKTDLSYLYFWDKKGFEKLDFKYIQPSLQEDKEAVGALHLIVHPLVKTSYIPKEKVIKFIFDYTKYAMSIEEPAENSSVKKMIGNMTNILKLIKII